jgi:hypothetical protein
MLEIVHILKDRVQINSPYQYLFGLKLQSSVETFSALPYSIARMFYDRGLASQDIKEQVFIFAFYRKKISNADGYLNEGYIFTYSPLLTKFIATNLPNYKIMSGYELANTVYRLHTLDETIKIIDKKIVRPTIFNPRHINATPVNEFYRELVKNSFARKDEIRAYFGVNLQDLDNVDWERVLLTDWEGVIWITFQFADFTPYIQRKILSSEGVEKKVWKKIKEANKTKLNLAGIEVFLLGRELDFDTAISIMNYLQLNTQEYFYKYYELIEKTPIKFYDSHYEHLDDIMFIRKLLPISLEKYTQSKNPLVYGFNINKTYVNFSPFEDASAPHTIAIAQTGSGKSVSLIEITRQALNIDLKKTIELGILPKYEKGVKIRYFDKGYTGEVFFKLLEIRGLNISRFSISPEEIKINPCEISDTSTDFTFSTEFISLILKTLDIEPLKGSERIIYQKALKEVYKDDDLKFLLGKQVEYFKAKGYSSIYNKLRKEGFKDDDWIKDIIEKKPDEFSFLKQPTVVDVFRFLNEVKNTEMFEDKEAIRSLITKLQAITEIPIFNSVSELNIKNSDIIYVDLDKLSSSPYFVPIVLGILKRLFYFDKYYKKAEDKALYFFDEAHTILKYEEFMRALDEAVREARKFGISLNFATQNWQEIPTVILRNIPTRYILTPYEQTEEKKREVIKEYQNKLQFNDEEIRNVKNLFQKLGRYTMLVHSDASLFSLKLPIDDTTLQIADAKKTYFLLPKERIALVRNARIDEETIEMLKSKGYQIV